MARKVPVLASQAGYDLAAPYYNEKEKFLNSFEQGKILPLLGDLKEKKILDVGAGTGRISIPLARAGAAVTALDVSKEMLQKIKKSKL